MAHRTILTERQRAALLGLPTDEPTLMQFYTLSDEDLEHIAKRRRPENKLGFALQLCALRYPGRLLAPGEVIPAEILNFLAPQIGINAEDLAGYAARRQTRHEHLDTIREFYGYRNFSGYGARELRAWLLDQAMTARTNFELAQRFVRQCRATRIILPAHTTIERLCADTLVMAERRCEQDVFQRIDRTLRKKFDKMLDQMVTDQLSRFVWFRQFEVGSNSRKANQLLARLERLRKFKVPSSILNGISVHQIRRLRRHGERYFVNELRDLEKDRRYAIVTVCIVEWQATIADALIETHERIVNKTWGEAKRHAKACIDDAKSQLQNTLLGFKDLGASMLDAKQDSRPVEPEISWPELEKLVATATQLTDTLVADPITHLIHGFHRFRRYAPRMLQALDIHAAPACDPLMVAVSFVADRKPPPNPPMDFLRQNSKWHRHLKSGDPRLWEIAVLCHVKDAFRAGDLWLAHSHQYADLKNTLVPAKAITSCTRLSVPLDVQAWLSDRKTQIAANLRGLAKQARRGTLPHAQIEHGILTIDRLPANTKPGADQLILDLYGQMPEARITDILLEANADIGFTDAFTHFRTGAPCRDTLGLMNVLLAEGLNLGLRKMSEASNSHGYWQLMRIYQWHIIDDAINRSLAMVVNAQQDLPMAHVWGLGDSASSDGQFFPTARQGEAMNLINARYGNDPGIKAYTHVSDKFAPFATQTIPATVNEAPYILDGLLLNETGRKIKEQYADTGGFTDHVFAVTSLLGFQFIPRIRDLPSKKLYLFDPGHAPKEIRGMIGGKIRENLIVRNWPDLLRIAATLADGHIPPSQLLRKLAAYPRQHELAVALREVGRVERTLFITRWLMDEDLQRKAQIGLNKGEAHHALKNAIRIGRQGEIRDRTSEGQRHRIAGLNLLAAVIIYWNTKHLGNIIAKRRKQGIHDPDDMLSHVSPLGWAHILLTGEYRWPKKRLKNP